MLCSFSLLLEGGGISFQLLSSLVSVLTELPQLRLQPPSAWIRGIKQSFCTNKEQELDSGLWKVFAKKCLSEHAVI